MEQEGVAQKKRYTIFDNIRGITLLSMIAYHGVWDLVYMYGLEWEWYKGTAAYVWQQSICWIFILLSGFCWSLGRNRLKRGFVVFSSGMLVTLVTLFFMFDNRVVFGILTLLGSCMLLLVSCDKFLRKVKPQLGLIGSFLLFIITRNCNRGFIGLENWIMFPLPKELYQGIFTTYLGFPYPDFYSTDYFSLFPWMFLFLSGYYIFHLFQKMNWMDKLPDVRKFPLANFIGRHSLVIYLVHQPLLYLFFEVGSYLLK